MSSADPSSRRRRWATHAGVVVTGLAAGVLAVLSAVDDGPFADGSGPLVFSAPVDVAIGCAAALLLLARNRRPLLVALTAVGISLLSTFAFGVALVALFAVGARCSWRGIALAVACNLAPVVVVWGMFVSRQQYVEGVVFMTLVVTVIITSGLLLRSWRDRVRQAEEVRVRDVAAARRLERERIAREMHDVLAHRISLLAVHAGALEYRQDAPPEQVRAAVAVIRASAYEALEELRAVIGVLREHDRGAGGEDDGGDGVGTAEPEPPQPTLAQLAALVEESRRSGARVDLDCAVDDPAAVPVAIGRHAYRIAQEGLTNARKHAPGATVRIAVAGEPGGALTVELRNRVPDSGARPARPLVPGAGAGLVGLRERADLVGGTLEHGRTAGGEFRLWASLPWPREPAHEPPRPASRPATSRPATSRHATSRQGAS